MELMRVVAVLIVLLVPRAVLPLTLDLTSVSQGTLTSAQSTTGATANEANFGFAGQRGAAVFQFRNAAGTATVELQVNCITGNTDWVTIPNSSLALTTTPAALDIVRPGCRYRGNVTACSSCSLTITTTSIGQ